MFTDLNTQVRQMVSGNLLLLVCCGFYLAWWLVAFHPTHAVKGFRSGWLLIPAFVFGLWAIVRVASGCSASAGQTVLIPGRSILIGGVLCYGVLLAGSTLLFRRQVTSELLIIITWAAFFWWEVSSLYGWGIFARGTAAALLAVIALIAAVSLVCYLFYYGLDAVRGYVDGMIPLLLAAAGTLAVTVCTLLLR